MLIAHANYPSQKECKVVRFCEPGQLRGIVKPHVDKLFYASVFQSRKEKLSSCFCKSDRPNADFGQITHFAKREPVAASCCSVYATFRARSR